MFLGGSSWPLPNHPKSKVIFKETFTWQGLRFRKPPCALFKHADYVFGHTTPATILAQKLQQVRAKPGLVNVCELLAGLNMCNDHDIKAAGHMQAAWKQSYV